jgi:hypothetical protein
MKIESINYLAKTYKIKLDYVAKYFCKNISTIKSDLFLPLPVKAT